MHGNLKTAVGCAPRTITPAWLFRLPQYSPLHKNFYFCIDRNNRNP